VRPERCRRCIIAASLGGALPICRPTAFQLGARSIIPAAEAQFAAVDPSRPLEAGFGKIVRGRVERTFGWFNWYRRLSKDYEHNPATSEAMIHFTASSLMLRRLATL
jgi:hypothetical protein